MAADEAWSSGKMPLESYHIHEVPEDVLAALDYCYEQGWTDGLPVVPPVTDRVEATLAYEGRPPEAVIATHPATGLQLSVHAAAVNARHGWMSAGIFSSPDRCIRGHGQAGIQLPRVDGQYRRFGAAPDRQRADGISRIAHGASRRSRSAVALKTKAFRIHPRPRKSGSQWTLCRREMDSNFRFRATMATVPSLRASSISLKLFRSRRRTYRPQGPKFRIHFPLPSSGESRKLSVPRALHRV